MKKSSRIFPTLMALAAMTGSAFAATTEKHVIALKTHDFTLEETDVSDLAIGEAETIVTESGKTVDIIRTADGFDVFVDGKQLDMPHLSDAEHQLHSETRVVECTGSAGSECEEKIVMMADGDWDVEAVHGDGSAHEVIVIKKSIERDDD